MAAPAAVESCNIVLDGFITQAVKSRIVIEIVKYLLYHREQIPLPFDQLHFQYQRQESCSAGNKYSLFRKRMSQLLRESQDLFDNIDTLFQDTDLSHLVIILGSTVISPKEVFHIRFLNNVGTNQTLSLKHCVRTVARSLITGAPLADSPFPPITNLLLAAHTPRSSTSTWFKPKANFKVPTKGRQCNIEISCGMASTPLSVEEHMWVQTPAGIKGIRDTVSEQAPAELWCS